MLLDITELRTSSGGPAMCDSSSSLFEGVSFRFWEYWELDNGKLWQFTHSASYSESYKAAFSADMLTHCQEVPQLEIGQSLAHVGTWNQRESRSASSADLQP